MRKRHPVLNAELYTQEVSNSREHRVKEVENRRNEHECKLDWLSNPGEERSECSRDHNAADLGPVLGSRTTPDCNRRSRQAPHLKQITACHISRRRITSYISVYLATDDLACGWINVLANLKEERHVPDVV
jgi:hypothetical protein